MTMANSPQRELADQVAVVTGSSSGIGRSTAMALASAGAHVVVHAGHRRERAEYVANEIRDLGVDVAVLVGDLSEIAGQDALAEQAWQWRGGIDIWINNAGADVLTGEPAGWSFERKLDALWRIDVTATMRLTRQIGARMRNRGQGAIINIGWDQAEHGMAGDSGELFAAAKGAIMAFTRSAAASLAPHVRVNCIAPGWIKTSWGETASSAWQERARRESLLARWGQPEDVAAMARFLASPAAHFVTGQIVHVNGGLRRG
jgi:3-oxoacyl-[acyl-carrier protein] reductase